MLSTTQKTNGNLQSLHKAIVVDAACPLSLFQRYKDDYGVELVQGWGITALCSASTLNVPRPGFASLDEKEQRRYPLKQGRAIFGLQVKTTNDADKVLPWESITARPYISTV